MLTTNFASGFSSNFEVTKPEIVYPPFSQVIVFNTATSGTRIKLPNYVNSVRIYAWGAGGAGGGKGPGLMRASQFPGSGDARPGGLGGHGGFVQGDFPIPPGEILYVRVGGGGISPGSPFADEAGGGGGYSSVELPSSYLNKYLVVAGGGGGGGHAPPQTSLTPSPAFPTGSYEPGYPGGPAFADGVGRIYLAGKGATVSSGGDGGAVPIGIVPVPRLGPYLGPIYGPLPPTSGPVRASQSGSFLRGGGDSGGGINGGGRGKYVIPAPVWGLPPSPPAVPPSSSFHPTSTESNIRIGGGGGGYYGGGMGAPQSYYTSTNAFGDAGGGGGSSYINPTGTNTVMANTAPYAPNPIYTAYFVAKPASSNTKADTATGGLGYVETSRTPAPAPFGGFYINGPTWLGQNGGDGLVVVVY
jgi:hypothetical protein